MMKRYLLQLIAICIVVAMLFSGCGVILQTITEQLTEPDVVHYSDMEYTRPDMAQLQDVLAETCAIALESTDVEEVMEAIYAFYDLYDSFYTNYFLADIRYSGDLTDVYWETEYNYCAENSALADSCLEELYYTLADSPCREELESEEYFGEGFFDAYEGESIWDDYFLELMDREAQLQNRYYELSMESMDVEYYSEEYFQIYGTQMAQVLVELIALRQEIAAYAGYDSYPEFAYDMYHYRDYTPGEAEVYLERISDEMVDLYRQVNYSGVWNLLYDGCSEGRTFAYVKTAAANMGGDVEAGFELLEDAGLYDIGMGKNKYNSSYEVYLWSYYEPFIFMCPQGNIGDQLTFAHEFGHFLNDYVCWGSSAGTDVAEVHSQAFEYLSLCYNEGTEDLTAYKMADTLCTYVEQAAYALFEQRVYGLTGEDLTVENVQALYEEICLDFGFDSWGFDSRGYVTVNHFYTNPMYVISYVVSCDVAFQIYQMELESPGAGLAVYEDCIYSMDSFLLMFAENYGLESPFADGRLEDAQKIMRKGLKDYL